MKWLWLVGAALSLMLGFATATPGSILPAAVCVWGALDAARMEGLQECARIYANALQGDAPLQVRVLAKLTAYFEKVREENGTDADSDDV